MKKFFRSSKYFSLPFFLVIILEVLCFVIDFHIPHGYAKWTLYFFPLLLIWNTTPLQILSVVTFVSVLELLGFFLSPAGPVPPSISLLNRLSGLIIFWTISLLFIARIKSHEAQSKSEQQYKQLIDAAKSIIIRWSPSGEILFINPYGLKFFGYTEEELTGKNIMILVPETESTGRDLTELTINITGHTSRFATFVNENVCKDGTKVWVSWTNNAFIDSNGQLLEILAIGNDITELKKTEKQLQESKAKLEAALNSMTDAVFISDTEGRFIDFNDAFATFQKFSNKNECAKTLAEYPKIIDVSYPDGKPVPLNMWAVPRALRGEVVNNAEYILQRKDTGESWIGSFSFAPIRDNQGNIAGSVVVGRDITERKKAEQNLRESEERLRLATEAAQLGIFDWDIQNDRPLWDKRMYEIFGMKSGDTPVNREVFVKEIIHPDDLQRFIRELNESMRKGNTFNGSYRIRRRNDGQIFWIQYFGKFELSPEGKPIRLVSTLSDITEHKVAEQELKKSEENLRILNENLENLVIQRTEQVRALSKALTLAEQHERKQFSQILHENIQQKLFGARLLFKQYLRSYQSKVQSEELADIEDGIELLENALRTTKTLSIELNPPVLSTEGLDAALRWLVTFMHNTYKLNVDLQMHGHIEMVRHETQLMLTQMVRYLLNNVIRHAGVFDARMTVDCTDGCVKISVIDAGRGFNPSNVLSEKVDENRLGLLSIKERLKLFNGDLTIQSAVGQGTQVTIILPYQGC